MKRGMSEETVTLLAKALHERQVPAATVALALLEHAVEGTRHPTTRKQALARVVVFATQALDTVDTRGMANTLEAAANLGYHAAQVLSALYRYMTGRETWQALKEYRYGWLDLDPADPAYKVLEMYAALEEDASAAVNRQPIIYGGAAADRKGAVE